MHRVGSTFAVLALVLAATAAVRQSRHTAGKFAKRDDAIAPARPKTSTMPWAIGANLLAHGE